MLEIEENASYILHLFKPNFRCLPLVQQQETHLSWPRRIPAEFPPRENTESQHLPWKSQSTFFNPLNVQFILLNLHLHPRVPEQKPGTQALLIWLPQLDSTGPNSSEMECKIVYVCASSMYIRLVTRDTEQQNRQESLV